MPKTCRAMTTLLSIGLAAGLTGWTALSVAQSVPNSPTVQQAASKTELPFPGGKEWLNATEQAKLAYLLGIMNLAMVEYQLTGPNPKHRTTTTKLVKALDGMTLRQIMEAVDTYYRANPDQQQTPIVEVIWFQLVEPKGAKSTPSNSSKLKK